MKHVLAQFSNRHTVKWVIVALVVLVVADGLLTNLLIQQDIAREWNPFLVSLAGRGGLLVVKIVGSVVCAFLLWDIYKHWPRLGVVSAYTFLLIYSGIVLWNLTLFLGAQV